MKQSFFSSKHIPDNFSSAPSPGAGEAVRRRKHGALFALCLAVFVLSLTAITAFGQESGKTVRVGWFESSFCATDEFGRRSGYAYEYQQELAAYTGWNYEYVSGSWSTLMEMLIDGEIDLLSDVSITPAREDLMLFPSLSMGTEEYYLFIASGNKEITPDHPASLNGKRVCVNKGSLQKDLFLEWAEKNGVSAELIEVTGSEAESLDSLEKGVYDAYVTVDSFANPERMVPVFKIGSSDFYFAVNKNRPDLLSELDSAMNRIQDEDRYYNQKLYETYVRSTGPNAFLTEEEEAYLDAHGPIRVGYQDNYLAFCAADEATGELTGALKDYLAHAADCLANAHLDFEATAYPTAGAAIDALKRGEVDCVFPANISNYDAEEMGILLTPYIMRTETFAVVRQADQNLFSKKEHVIVAVNEGNPNYETFLMTHFPDWRKIYFPDTEDCLHAVADRVADCVLISSYRYNNISRLCERRHLATISVGETLDYSFAVGRDNSALYAILSKSTGLVPDSALNVALTYYITEDARFTFLDFVMDNLWAAVGLTAAVLLVIILLLLRSMRSEKTAKMLISATETDDLTGLYNRKYFFQYANRLYRAHPDVPMDAFVINIEQFHSVNALKGRNFGDRTLRALGSEISEVAREYRGIAGRFEADRFDIYCRHTDEYQAIFKRLQDKLDSLSPNTSIRIRMGVMPWQAELEPVQLFDRARTACGTARGHYKEHLVIYDEKAGKQEMFEQRLLSDLRRALDAYEFEVYYQPKFDIQTEPPALMSAEALVRWNHPELGMITPDDFVPLLERNGKISEVDKYVWEHAARQIRSWREQYGVSLSVSVNLSRVDVFDPMLSETLDEILRFNGLDHNQLVLEVTESAYTENAEQVIRVVGDLRKKGYKVEMDDFGTGYSSLNMLSRMPVDVLKMDRAFIRDIEFDAKDRQFVSLILGIADNLQIPVVAEGVETEKQVALLKNLGCALVQGYYFSRPLHPVEFEAAYIRPKE